MDEVIKSLTAEERALLSDLVENREVMKALTKALLQRQLSLSVTSMSEDLEWEQYLQNKGEIRSSKWIITFLKENHKKWQKSREKTQTNQETIE